MLYRYQFIMNTQETHFCLANLQLREIFIGFLTLLIPFIARCSRLLLQTLKLLCRILVVVAKGVGVLVLEIYIAARETLSSLLSVYGDAWHEFCLWDELTDDDRNGARCDTCFNRHF